VITLRGGGGWKGVECRGESLSTRDSKKTLRKFVVLEGTEREVPKRQERVRYAMSRGQVGAADVIDLIEPNLVRSIGSIKFKSLRQGKRGG